MSSKLNCGILELRKLFLIDNMMDSIKFGLGLWLLTYIGAWFNAMTLVILAWVGLFTIPKVRSEIQARFVGRFVDINVTLCFSVC